MLQGRLRFPQAPSVASPAGASVTSFFKHISEDPRYLKVQPTFVDPGTIRNRITRGWLVTLLGKLIIAVVKLRFRVVLVGRLPLQPCLVFSRHDSYWDGVIISVLDSRVCPVTSRFWKNVPVAGAFLTGYGVIWTEEDTVARSVAAIRAGRCPWIAPYGFEPRSGRAEPRGGAALIAKEVECPLVQVVLARKRAGRLGQPVRPTLEITVREPLMPLPGESAQALTRRLHFSQRE